MAEPYLGEIRLFAGSFAPIGWALCDGALLNISRNDMLYALIGTTYGGDGITTFALPDLQGRVGIHQGTNQGTGTNYVMGQEGGSETVTVVQSQMPMHTHSVGADNNSGITNDPKDAFWAKSTINQYAKSAPDTKMNSQAIATSGGSQPHENMMPSLTVSYIIALEGIFPSQG